MILNNRKVKRLGIFFAYDKDGIIDDYIIILLQALRKHMSKILVVCNGVLSAAGRQKLNNVVDEILVRKNIGFDGWAYKEGIEFIGWDNLNKYDELIMFNHTIMGPVNSFDEMFDYMDKMDIDFWGITKHHKIEIDPFGKYEHLPEYLQTYFIGVKKSMFSDRSFSDYWNEFPEFKSCQDAFMNHEAVFTKKFADMGFKYSTYVQTDDIEYMNSDPLMYMTMDLVKNRKCPVFKRRMFFQEHADILVNTMGNTAREFFDYLVKSNKYDVNLIWDNILRTCNQEDIVRCLNLRYILSSSNCDMGKVQTVLQKRKIALVMHLYFEDLIREMCQYASYMPEEADIYITTNSVQKRRLIQEEFTSRLHNRVEVRVIENRGRDVSSILVGVKDIIQEYDYVCFVHDKKTAQLKPGTVGSGFASKCFENTIYNSNFVNNVLCLLEDNPRMGILSPPSPNHADFIGTLGNEWGPNFDNTIKLAEKLDINVPMNRNKMAIAPYGTLFWFRPVALKKLYDADWEYSDFPKEPNENDGTLLHAIERIYPLVVQSEGYYPAILMSDYYAGIECTNLDYYARTFNNKVADIFGYNYHFVQLNRLSEYKRMKEEFDEVKGQKYELELKSLETMQYVDSLKEELDEVKGQKYELELKSLETMQYVDSLKEELDEIKGQKYELELKSLETMQHIEELQEQIENIKMQTNLKYQIKKNIKKIF